MYKTRLMVMLLMLSTTTSAFGTPTCQEVIQACDLALAEKQKQVEIRDLRLKETQNQLRVVTDQRDAAERRASAWYRSPILWGVLGLAGGIVIMRK